MSRSHSDELCEIPIASADYFFMGESGEPGCIASLAIKDCRSKSLISFAVPRKGKDVYAVQRVLQALAFFGHRRAIIRTDQEPSIIALIDEAKINTLTVMIMQVPCCNGLLMMAQEAAKNAQRKIPLKKIIVGLEGNILQEEWV